MPNEHPSPDPASAPRPVSYEVAEGVAVLTLNRPAQKNAMNAEMREEIASIVAGIKNDPTIRALVLAGAGGAFCAGGDIRDMPAGTASVESGLDRLQGVHAWLETLIHLDCPVIAAVDGVAYGAGFSLALTADFILASPTARFCMPFLRLGLIPDLGAMYTLPRVIGLQRAKELIYSTREVGAQEAVELGIVFEIQPQDQLLARARALALTFAHASRTALSLTKRALGQTLNTDLRTLLDLEAAGQAVARTSEYHQNAVKNFREKRPPMFVWPASDPG